MSRDDWIAVIKERKKFVGYWCSASIDYPTLKSIKMQNTKLFTVKTIEEAILKAQKQGTEYGYMFLNLKKVK